MQTHRRHHALGLLALVSVAACGSPTMGGPDGSLPDATLFDANTMDRAVIARDGSASADASAAIDSAVPVEDSAAPEDGAIASDGATVTEDAAVGADATTASDAAVEPDSAPAPVCGNRAVETGEQCDDGNSMNGDGCENSCQFTCVMDSQCADTNACNGAETCNVATHTCRAGTAATDGTACGMGSICVMGACAAPRCGDRVVSGTEQCDDGNMANGDGCETTCRFTCAMDSQCADTNACNGAETCVVATHTCRAGTALADNTPCGGANICRMGACVAPLCGNGTLDPGEECDDRNMVNGDGCETTCRFTCATDSQCADTNACNGAETCNVATHVCRAGTAPADGFVCDADMNAMTRDICRMASCRASTCGDGFVDMGRGEACEPPTPGCSPTTCQLARCGNMVIEPGEECDDGNTNRWDGCSNVCRLEQTVRANQISIVQSTARAPVGCDLTGDGRADNRLGEAITDLAIGTLNNSLRDSVNMGVTNVLAHFLDLDDRLGRNDPMIRLAFLTGADAVAPFQNVAGEGFTIPRTELDAMSNPASIFAPAAIATTTLTGGPGTIVMRINLAGTLTALTLNRGRVSGTVTSNAAMNRIEGITNGRICGALSAGDLDRIPWPAGLPGQCAVPTTMVAGSPPSMLDMFVRGCGLIASIPIINPIQPDMDIAGDGIGTLPVLRDTNNDRIIDRCFDSSSNTMIDGANCAQDPRFDDGYSAALNFAAVRVLITGLR